MSFETFAQCSPTYDQNGTNLANSDSLHLGQSFIAECSGNITSVQLIANSTGTITSAGLRLYSGNTVSGTALAQWPNFTETINQVGDPIIVSLTGYPLIENNQYTFLFTVNDGIDIMADSTNGYPGGSMFINGNEESSKDALFSVIIEDPSVGLSDEFGHKKISIFPNPANSFITLSNLKESEIYTIVNALGQEILKGSIIVNDKIDIRNLNKGLYYLKLGNGTTRIFMKK